MENCQKYEGLRDLMEMWFYETSQKERDKILVKRSHGSYGFYQIVLTKHPSGHLFCKSSRVFVKFLTWQNV